MREVISAAHGTENEKGGKEMDKNSKLAIVMLIVTVILILIAVLLLLWMVRTDGLPEVTLPEINLPEISLPFLDRPQETEAPADFHPSATPEIQIPEIVIPSFAVPSVPMPGATAVPSAAPHVTPPPENRYDSVFFGHYEQGSGIEDIEWLVLEEQDDRSLLISRYALDVLKYHGKAEDVTWETCDLRAWLNSEFLDFAFTPEEQEAILMTEVDNSVGNPIFRVDGGNNTLDRVWLLSREEMESFFPTEGERLCEPTRATRNASLRGYSAWWLRSPGYLPSLAEYVGSTGGLLDGDVDRGFTAIRPVIWVEKRT